MAVCTFDSLYAMSRALTGKQFDILLKIIFICKTQPIKWKVVPSLWNLMKHVFGHIIMFHTSSRILTLIMYCSIHSKLKKKSYFC